MALTTLDPHTALIIVDLQKGIVGLPLVHSVADIITRARSLADAFGARTSSRSWATNRRTSS